MTTFRLLWQIHKWVGVSLGIILLLSASTGLLLLFKKDFEWIQPPTQRGTNGPAELIAPMHEIYAAVFALGLPQLRSEADIDRIDFRPAKRIFKVRARQDQIEVQVDAIAATARQPEVRRSDLIEQIHDGQFFGAWAHGLVMPIAGVGLVVLAITGYLLWIWPGLVRRRKRALQAAAGS